MHQRDGQTDGRMDTGRQQRPRLRIASRSKNNGFLGCILLLCIVVLRETKLNVISGLLLRSIIRRDDVTTPQSAEVMSGDSQLSGEKCLTDRTVDHQLTSR